MRCVGYVRVSNDKHDLSPESQRREMELWCSATGNELVGLESDLGVSGAVPADKRPGLLRAIESVGEDRPAEVLLVLRPDRLARSVIQACAIQGLLERQGGKLRYVSGSGNGDTAEDRLIRQILDAFAEYERAVIRLRVTAAMARGRAEGRWLGECPYGYRIAADGVHLEEDPEEQAVLRRIWAARERGLSLRAIVSSLNEQGVPARGKAWHYRLIQRIAKKAPILQAGPSPADHG